MGRSPDRHILVATTGKGCLFSWEAQEPKLDIEHVSGMGRKHRFDWCTGIFLSVKGPCCLWEIANWCSVIMSVCMS